MGEARGHLDRLAAQPPRLAEQTRPDSMVVWRDRAQQCDGRDCAHPGEFRSARKTGARRAEKSGCGFKARAIYSFCDESRMDTGFRADFCAAREAAARSRDCAIPIQCLGALSGLAERRCNPGTGGAAVEISD